MNNIIDGKDFVEMEPMKYWSMPPRTSAEDKKRTVNNAIFSGDYIGALKCDGYYQRICKDEDGNIYMIARNRNVKGEIVDKHEWVPHLNPWFESLPNGTCLLCECYLPEKEGSKNITTILGCLKDKAIARQAKTPLHLYIFDCIAYNGKSHMNTPYEERARLVREIAKNYTNEYVEYAEFYEGEELWEKLQSYLASGREGMVIMKKNAIVYEKRTPARVSIKVKKELQETIDCFFTGKGAAPTRQYSGKEIETWQYWINDITGERLTGNHYKEYMNGDQVIPVTKPYYNKWASSLEIAVMRDGKVWPIGWLSGLTDDIKANFKDYENRCLEVAAMQFTDETMSALRHGKMMCLRDDLSPADCTYEKMVGTN